MSNQTKLFFVWLAGGAFGSIIGIALAWVATSWASALSSACQP